MNNNKQRPSRCGGGGRGFECSSPFLINPPHGYTWVWGGDFYKWDSKLDKYIHIYNWNYRYGTW